VYRWCRRCVVTAFALVVFGTTAGIVILARLYTDSDEVRRIVERNMSKISPNSKVAVADARAHILGGTTLENISWHQTDGEGVDREVMKNGDLSVSYNSRDLAGGKIAITKMTLTGGEIKFHFDKDGRCAAFTFRQAADESVVTKPIALDVVNATVHMTFESATNCAVDFKEVSGRLEFVPNKSASVDLRGRTNGCLASIKAEIDMQNKQAKIVSLGVEGAPVGKLLASLPPTIKNSLAVGVFDLGKADLSGSADVVWRDDQPRIAGWIQASMDQKAGRTCVKSARLAGSFDAKTGTIEVQEAKLEDADLAASLPLVPAEHRSKIASPETLRGLVQVSAKGKVRTKETPLGWEGKATAELSQASWSPPQSPFPITAASASIEVTPAGLAVHRAEATLGTTKTTASGVLPNWDAQRARLEFTAAEVPFAKELRERLPAKLGELWDKFGPEGHVSLAGEAAMNGGKPRFIGHATLNGNAFTYEKFPYRVKDAQGRIDCMPDGRMEFDLVGSAGGASCKLTGSVSDTSPTSEIDIRITGSDVSIDDDLRRAFAPIKPAAAAIQKIRAVGKGKCVITVKRQQGSRVARVNADVDMDLRNFTADWFPYPLDQVTGRVLVAPDRIEFQDCLGTTQGGGTVRMNGWTQRDGPLADAGDPTGRNHVRLDFLATDAPLDRTLRDSIPAKWHGMWDHLQPEGSISLTANFDQPAGQEASLSFLFDGSKAAITPASFPYRVHDIRGPIEMRDKVVFWKGLTARHGDVEWRSGKGFVRPIESGGGELHFDQLYCARLPIDADLKAASPPSIRSVMEFLSPNVPADRVNLEDFTVTWQGQGGSGPAFEIGNAKATFVDADLVPSIGAKKVTGEISLTGCHHGVPEFKGNIYLHSVSLAGLKATSVQSRIEVHGPRIDFEGLKADFYGGTLHGIQLIAVVEPVPEYQATLKVVNAKLKDYVRKAMDAELPLDAAISANLELKGRGRTIGKLSGHGSLEMQDLDVLQLPIVLDQLNFILTKLPAKRTFDKLQARFQLDGPRMFINELKMESPTIGFALQKKATGVVDLSNGALALDMVSELTRSGIKVPFFTPATAFHVGGTFRDPKITPDPVSGFRRAFTPARGRRE
jgi:hypothetical protein